MPGETADAGELAVVLTSIDAQFKSSMKEATAALDRVADKMVEIPTEPLAGGASALRGVAKAGGEAEAGIGGVVEKFGSMGRSLSHINPELGHMAYLTHALELLANPVALLGVAFAAAAFGIYKLVEASNKLTESNADSSIASMGDSLDAEIAGIKAYDDVLAKHGTVAEAVRAQDLASAKSHLATINEVNKKEIDANKAKIDALMKEQAKLAERHDEVTHPGLWQKLMGAEHTNASGEMVGGQAQSIEKATAALKKNADEISTLELRNTQLAKGGTGTAKAIGEISASVELLNFQLEQSKRLGFDKHLNALKFAFDSEARAIADAESAEKVYQAQLDKRVSLNLKVTPAMYAELDALHARTESLKANAAADAKTRAGLEKDTETYQALQQSIKDANDQQAIGKLFAPKPQGTGLDAQIAEVEAALRAAEDEMRDAQKSGLLGDEGSEKWKKAAAGAKLLVDQLQKLKDKLDPVAALVRDMEGMGSFLKGLAQGVPIAAGALFGSGIAGSTAAAAMKGGEEAGPYGAAAAALANLVTSSKGFQDVMARINPIAQALADSLGSLFEDAVMPLAPLLKETANLLRPLIAALEPLIRILAQAFPLVNASILPVVISLRLLSAVVHSLFDAIKAVALGILKAVKWVAHELGIHISGLNQAISDLSNTTWDSANSVNGLGKAAQDAAGALTNLPQGFKYALRKFQSEDPSGNGPGGGSGGGNPAAGGLIGPASAQTGPTGGQAQSFHRGGVHIAGDLVLHGVQNVADLHRELKRLGRRGTVRTNGFLPDGV